MTIAQSTGRSTLIGFSAICWWMIFPLMVALTTALPALQSIAVTFTSAFFTNLVLWLLQGACLREKLSIPLRGWLLGIYGLFGFHVAYYLAMRWAPPANVVLIINLWPVMILIFAAWWLKSVMRINHWIGVAMGFAGVAIIASQKGDMSVSANYVPGYLCALVCAVTWASYSVLQRKWAQLLPRDMIGGVCGAVAILSWICHFFFEQTASIPLKDLLILVVVGIGPIGLAYIAWAHGMRHGDIRVLSSLSFLGPTFGMTLLILFGFAHFTPVLAIAMLLVLGGAAVGSFSLFKR